MRNFSLFIFLFYFLSAQSQTVNLFDPVDNSVYPAQMYFCTGESFNLKVDAAASSTGDYKVEKDFPTNYPLTGVGTPIVFQSTGSNKFSQPIPIGFTFSFYGKDYTKVVAGSNGRLVFTNDSQLANLQDINTYTDRTFSGVPLYNTYSKLPSTDYNKVYKNNAAQELPLAQIFFGYTDLVPASQASSVTYFYKSVKVGGEDALQIIYQNQIQTDGTGTNSSDAYNSSILLIADGRIVVYVNGKTDQSFNAILGIQNEDATKFKVPDHSTVPSDYNNGHWKSEGLAMVFTPNQNLTPKFKWYQNAVLLGETSNTLNNFEPNDGDVLKVEVTYDEDAAILKTGQVSFVSLKTPQISPPNYSGGCGNPAEIHVLNPDMGLVYDWYSDTDPSFHQTGTSIQVGNGSYYVQVKSTRGTCTLKSASQAVSISSPLPPFVYENQTIKVCDNAGSANKTFDLAAVTGYPLDPANYSVQFFEAGSSTPITTTTLTSGQTKNYTITVATNAGVSPACSFTKSFSIRYQSFPPDNTVYTSAKLCADVTVYTTTDFKNGSFAGSNFQVQFSTDGTNYTLNSVNPQNTPSVWVKITHPDFSCESKVKLNFDFHPDVQVRAYTQFPEHCTSTTEYFDLNITKTQLEYSSDIKVTFYRDQALTDQITNLNYRGSGTVYIKIENSTTGCTAATIPELNLVIYSPPTLIKTTPETKYSPCGSTVFNLTTNISDYIGSWTHYSEIRYYDFAGNRLSQAEWENYDLATRQQPYMIFVYNETNNLECSNRIEFNLIPLAKPVAIISEIQICAELTYSLEDFKDKVISNSANYTFTDDAGNPLPNSFDVTTLPKTIKFLMKDKTTGCLSDVQTVTFVKGENSVLLNNSATITKCDTDFDGKTDYNLDDVKTNFTTDPDAKFEYFKDSEFDKPIAANYTNETAFAQTVFVRVTVPTFCPSAGEIHLVANIPTKSSTLTGKYFICYGEKLEIDAGPENDDVQWSDGQTGRTATFTEAGAYSVTLRNGPNGCPYTQDFIISEDNQPKIQVINQTNTSIEVIADGGVKPYRYYFNGVPQNSNILQNPTAPSYEIQVESATGCFGPPKTVYFIKINNAFTPNADGINDFWHIENLDKMEKVSIVIVDRNGTKVFESTNPNQTEWDGKQNGRALPTSSYWYAVSWYDAVTQKTEQRQGWILLKNRN